jgi:hypothetical protein
VLGAVVNGGLVDLVVVGKQLTGRSITVKKKKKKEKEINYISASLNWWPALRLTFIVSSEASVAGVCTGRSIINIDIVGTGRVAV